MKLEDYFMNIRFVVVDVILFCMNHVQLRHERCMKSLRGVSSAATQHQLEV